MRIIAGQHRGRKLLPPSNDATRPITDRVKQSLFDILTPILPNANVYDLFAGTGSLGLESLSRGAQFVTFFESDHSAATLLRKNIQSLNLANQSAIITQDLFTHFSKSPQKTPIDLIFLDPPYRFLTERPADLQKLATILAASLTFAGIIVFRHNKEDELPLLNLQRYDLRTYGNMSLEFLTSPPANAPNT